MVEHQVSVLHTTGLLLLNDTLQWCVMLSVMCINTYYFTFITFFNLGRRVWQADQSIFKPTKISKFLTIYSNFHPLNHYQKQQ
jgi:Na+/melibiose symporter-like transporter